EGRAQGAVRDVLPRLSPAGRLRASIVQQPRGSPRSHRGEEPAGEGLQPDLSGATPFGPCLRPGRQG
ncbi:unnamed protein product, partial [Ectocarpus sp. 8 AP-2014]